MTDEAPEPIPYRTDPAAGERFIKQHYAGIYRMLLHFTGSVETAEDLTQQVFVSAWQALPGFRGEARLSTWLRKIAYHEYTHWLRAQKLHASLEEASEGPDLRNAAGLHTIMLRAALRALPL
ncbi:MAG TPA: sigma-70 family RNA polymerase sigma factor, partial [Chthonomonadales bacterium]|nr:sigma-70 family RNA polymerase sigma factor [Chthonomonadales bacterium]